MVSVLLPANFKGRKKTTPQPPRNPAASNPTPSSKSTKSKQNFRFKKKDAKPKLTSRDVLLAEIAALGESDDLTLLADVLSGSENEEIVGEEKKVPMKSKAKKSVKATSSAPESKTILGDLMGFMKQIGLDPSKPMQFDDDEDDVLDENPQSDDDEVKVKSGPLPKKTDQEESKAKKTPQPQPPTAKKDKEDVVLPARVKETPVGHIKFINSDGEEEEEDVHVETPQTASKQSKLIREKVSAILAKAVDDSRSSEAARVDRLLIAPGMAWFEALPRAATLKTTNIPASHLDRLKSRAEDLFDEECEKYEKLRSKQQSFTDRDFIASVLRSGTTTDRISTLTLLITESPLHNLKNLQALLSMSKKKSRREALLAMGAVRDLCISSNLLPDAKLKYFMDFPFINARPSDKELITAHFENALKNLYFMFLQTLEQLSHDPMPFVRTKTLNTLYTLLCKKPEGEQNLLKLLVNKLGDTDRQVASRCSYLLTQLTTIHPGMKQILISEVRELVNRCDVADKAVYYAIVGVNQIILTKREETVARNCVELYLDVFRCAVDKQVQSGKEKEIKATPLVMDEKAAHETPRPIETKDVKDPTPTQSQLSSINPKLLSALLSGLYRAYPFSSFPAARIQTHLELLFKLVHLTTNFSTSLMSLRVIFQILKDGQIISDRYFRTLYSIFQPPTLTLLLKSSKHHTLLLNLVFQSLKYDESPVRIKAFLKRLLQSTHYACDEVGWCAGVLFLVSEVMKVKGGIWSCVALPEDGGEEVEKFGDMDEDGFVVVPATTTTTTTATSAATTSSIDEDAAATTEDQETGASGVTEMSRAAVQAWICPYDPRKRDPQYSNADKTCFWELTHLTSHYHPTIAHYAETLLSSTPLSFPDNYDPLTQHSLTKFLDRFTSKNPKKMAVRGGSLMQPKGMKSDGELFLKLSKRAVNTGDINADEMFVQKFIQHTTGIHPSRRQLKPNPSSLDLDIEGADAPDSNEEEMDDDEVWKAMRRSSGFPDAAEDGEDGDEGLDGGEEDDEEEFEKMMKGEVDIGDEANDDDDDEEDMDDDDLESAMMAELENAQNDVDEDDVEEDEAENDLGDNEDVADEGCSDDGDDEEDAALNAVFADSDDETPLVSEATTSKKSDLPKAMDRLARKAKALGYTGEYFSEPSRSKKSMKAGMGVFASMDDFENLIESTENDEPEVGEERKGGNKRKRIDSASASGGRNAKRPGQGRK